MRGTASKTAKPMGATASAQGPTATMPPSGWGEPATDTQMTDGPTERQGSFGRQMSRMAIKKAGICFPCEPFGYCPAAIKGFIPGTWQKIQDTTHCMLVLGLVSSLTMMLLDAVDLFSFAECIDPSNFFCVKEFVILVFGGPFFWYCASTITQYDQDLQEKQKMVKQQMNQLLGGLKELVGEMEGLMAGAMESSTGLAEKNFDDKRRDFSRFLQSAKKKYEREIYPDTEVVTEFKTFCLNWLNIFKECSIDPVGNPKTLIDPEELDRCISIQETADLILERLRVTEVKFMTAKRLENETKIKQRKGSLLNLIPGRKQMMLTNGNGDEKDENLIAGQSDQAKDDFMDDVAVPDKITWISCGASGCGCSSGEAEDGFPKECRCICMKFSMLSNSHRNLLFVFVLGFLLLAFEAMLMGRHAVDRSADHPDQGNPFLFMLVAATQLSLITVLCRFEAIDVVEQLKREVQALQKENETVQEERKDMTEFWTQANNLTECWLYRTVPRLGITKEVTNVLMDAMEQGEDGIGENLKSINKALANIEVGIGKIEDWKGNGKIGINEKKAFLKLTTQIEESHRGLGGLADDLGELKALRLTNG